MEKQINYVDDMINRYIYQVMKHLSSANRKDIEEELRTLISDMLEVRASGNTPNKEDIDAVLKELGNPYDLSEKYSDNSHYLISPVIYPTYMMVLKIVLYATLLGMLIATFVGIFTTVNTDWYKNSGSYVADIIDGLLASFAWVTIIFVILERKGVNLNKKAAAWEPSKLPPTLSRELEIPLRRPIVNIAFNVFVAVIFIFAPQILGAYILSDTTRVIPIFNLEVLRTVLPIFLICIGLSITKGIWEIIEQKITILYAVFITVIDFVQLFLFGILLTKFQIWNTSFLTEQNSLFHMEGNLSYHDLWNRLNSIVLSIIAIIYLIEILTTFYKAIKYNTHNN